VAAIDFSVDVIRTAFEKLEARAVAKGVTSPAIDYATDTVRVALAKLEARAAVAEAAQAPGIPPNGVWNDNTAWDDTQNWKDAA
jgi:hypothetical protein